MQLKRARLKGAVAALLASTLPAVVRADATAPTLIDASMLYYGEKGRTTVLEPTVRVTRLFGAQALLYGQAGYDVITGASPTGAAPASGVQTTTTPSGNTVSSATGEVPTQRFSDRRWVGQLGGKVPLALGFALGASAHVSRERDYRSTGGTATLTLECMQKLTTFSALLDCWFATAMLVPDMVVSIWVCRLMGGTFCADLSGLRCPPCCPVWLSRQCAENYGTDVPGGTIQRNFRKILHLENSEFQKYSINTI